MDFRVFPSGVSPGTCRTSRRQTGSASIAPRRRYDIADDEIERARFSERARFAAQLDAELLVACRGETAARRHVGELARQLLRDRSYQRLGFARLADYARERLGLSARTVESAAWVADRLDELPLVASALDRSEISWAQARTLCGIASAADECAWLQCARQSTVAELAAIAATRRPRPSDPEGDDDLIDDEPAQRLRITCSARARALWRRAVELASRAAGESLARWRAAEAIAAEALSGRPADARIADRALVECMRLAQRERRRARAEARAASEPGVESMPTGNAAADGADARNAMKRGTTDVRNVVEIAPPSDVATPMSCDGPPADPFALDAQLRFAVQAIHTSEPRIGRLLRVIIDQKFYRTLRFPSVSAYVRERLGISPRKAWALVKVEKSTWRAGEFQRAYHDGRLSWCRALTLIPVVDHANAAAWIERAERVTVRRLADEVNHVMEAVDVFGTDVPRDPPSIDDPLPSAAAYAPRVGGRRYRGTASASACGVQTCAHVKASVQTGAYLKPTGTPGEPESLMNLAAAERARLEVCDTEVQFTGPASVVALFRDALDAFSQPGDPRALALERVLRHAIGAWEALPRHHDPIFARDGWRCTVPGCTGRRNLHDHHVVWRSRGGDNGRDNRTAVCAAHHLHGLHRHAIRAWGEAPHAIHWELGVRPNRPPLVSYVGDRLSESPSA